MITHLDRGWLDWDVGWRVGRRISRTGQFRDVWKVIHGIVTIRRRFLNRRYHQHLSKQAGGFSNFLRIFSEVGGVHIHYLLLGFSHLSTL